MKGILKNSVKKCKSEEVQKWYENGVRKKFSPEIIIEEFLDSTLWRGDLLNG